MTDDICDRFGLLLRDFDHVWLDPESFAVAVHEKGAPLQHCFGFIGGTVRPIARPTVNHRIMYSCHKKVHCLKFQVCTSNCDNYVNQIIVFLPLHSTLCSQLSPPVD